MPATDADSFEIDASELLDGEPLKVWRHRYQAARRAGLEPVEAAMFAAASEPDAAYVRDLATKGWTGEQIARVVL